LEAFRTCLPDINKLPETISSDPWWVFTRANVAAADVLFYAESAVHETAMYEFAVIAARRMVELMRGIPLDLYAHLSGSPLPRRFLEIQAHFDCFTPPHPRLISVSIVLRVGPVLSSHSGDHFLPHIGTPSSRSLLHSKDCFVFVDVSLVARFLYREASRLRETGTTPKTWQAALSDADLLLQTLEDKAGKWHPFGLYLADDVRRVKQGQRERPELYERAV
jgi:hypothetical protein